MKYRVWLPEQERIIEADSEDEAQDIFQAGDGIFDFLEVEEVEEMLIPGPQVAVSASEDPAAWLDTPKRPRGPQKAGNGHL